MFPPGWGFLPTTSAMFQRMQHDLEEMQERFGALFKTMLAARPGTIGRTPAETVYTEHNVRLLHYRPTVAEPHPVPLLIVPSVIKRALILDLAPGRSLVEHLVGQGLDVYMIDWGKAGPEQRSVTLDQYVVGYLRRVVQHVHRRSGQSRINLLGYSLGGTLTAIFSALYGRYVQSLVQLAAPINFHDEGLISQWTRPERFNVDLIVNTLSTMPLELMRASLRMLQPTAQIMQQIALAERFGDTHAIQDLLAMQVWMSDMALLPGEAYRTFIKECYQANHLVQGKLVIGGQRVDLRRIDQPLLTIAASGDRICPPRSVAALNEHVASADRQVLEIPGGHIDLVVSSDVTGQLWPQISAWLIARSAVAEATDAAMPELEQDAMPAAEPSAAPEAARSAAANQAQAAHERAPKQPSRPRGGRRNKNQAGDTSEAFDQPDR
ncbi:MAG TPA: alpha/beta fold hydrolase [Herpetosiphonaceae bacterium]